MTLLRYLNPFQPADIGGSDLWIPFVAPNGETWYIAGDTFSGRGPYGPPRKDIGNWRSPMIIKGGKNEDPTKPAVLTGVARGGRQLRDYIHPSNDQQFRDLPFWTILPTDCVTVGDTMYMWVMLTKALGDERWMEIWTSKDGERWDYDGHQWDANAYGGLRRMLTWDRGGDGYVYAISTGGLARNKNAIMFRVPEDKILDESKWESWFWNGTSWGWTKDRATDILQPGYKLGELCLRRIQGHWIFSGFDAGAYNAFVKVGHGAITDINWHTAPDYRPVKGSMGSRGGPDIVSRLYGCYVTPNSRFDTAFGMVVSTWSEDGSQYQAMQFRIDGIKPTGNVLIDADVSTPETSPERVVHVSPGQTVEVRYT